MKMTAERLKKRVLAAKGEIPFDQLFYHARLVNVYTESVMKNACVGVVDGVIVSVCPSFEPDAVEKIDCGGLFLAPSLIDAHMHIESSHLSPAAYCEGAVPHGTGCIFTDPMQIANAAGADGVRDFCRMLERLPLRSYLQFPSRVPAAEGMETAGGYFSPETTGELMQSMDVHSLGEVNGADLYSEKTLQKIAASYSLGKPVNGHCPALRHDELCAAVAAGLCDDHESEAFEELYERLSLGMPVFVREGTIEPNCVPLITGVVKHNIPTDSLMFCTDDKAPADIKQNGCIDHAVRLAIKCGMNPIKAIKLATLNAARHFGQEHFIGSVAPGRFADFILFNSLEQLDIQQVYFGGKLVAEQGKLVVSVQTDFERHYPSLCKTVILPKNMTEADLAVPLPKECSRFEAVVMKIRKESLMTEQTTAVMEAKNGMANPDIQHDILPLAVIERYGKGGNIGHGFISGLGITRGAVAASMAQEGNNLVTCGVNYKDMLTAARAVEKMGGGAAICIDGKITAMLKYPIAGIMGSGSLDDEIRFSEEFAAKVAETGSTNPMLVTYLIVATCSSIPVLGLTDMGLIDVNSHKIIDPVSKIIRS